MNDKFKLASVLMVAALMLAAVMAVPVMADSSSSSDSSSGNSGGSNGGSSVSGGNSGSSGSSVVADDKVNENVKADVRLGDDKLKVDVKDNENRLKAEIKNDRLKAEIMDGQNELKTDIRVKDNNNQASEVRVKTEAKGGFAGVLSRLFASLFGKKEKVAEQAVPQPAAAPAEDKAQPLPVEAAAEAPKNEILNPAPGITIDKTLSQGPGYPTGPLDISLPATQLLLDKVGQVKGTEIKGRQYELPLETVPPTPASIPVMINGVSYTASEVKVISNLKTKAGAGQHQGTIDIDIDVPLGSALPAGHITLDYKGSATVSGSMISSGGVFKTSKMTGVFAGLVSEGTYSMTIIETGQTFGSPVMVSITTTSTV